VGLIGECCKQIDVSLKEMIGRREDIPASASSVGETFPDGSARIFF
jgi:hypothetical protein